MSAVHTSTARELDVQCTSNIRVSVSIRLQRRGPLNPVVDLIRGHYIIASWLCTLQQARVEFYDLCTRTGPSVFYRAYCSYLDVAYN